MNEYIVRQADKFKMSALEDEKYNYKVSRGDTNYCFIADYKYYKDKALILADNLNEVFEIGNDENIENNKSIKIRFDYLYSISVGDIIIDKTNGVKYVVQPIGFAEL